MQDIGFVHFWAMRDYKGAAEWFERGSKVPGAAWFLKPLAATTLAQGGHRSASRTLFGILAETGENDWIRKDAQAAAAPARRHGRASTSCARMRRPSIAQRGGATPVTWDSAGPGRLPARHPDRSGRLRLLARTVERRRRPRRGLDAGAAAARAAPAPVTAGGRLVTPDRSLGGAGGRDCRGAGPVRPHHRQLPQRLHLPHPARAVDRPSRRRGACSAARRCAGTTTCRW